MRPSRKTASPVAEEVDVVVVGLGGAGACAAIQAAGEGCRVLVLERFAGGGATRKSGGVIYAGGGSAAQRAAGFQDSAEEMVRYLRRETGGSVPDPILRSFCEGSLEQLAWLEGLGLTFPEKCFVGKTTQPPDGFGLYFSGNERQRGADARPAPRGHLPAGRGMTGGVLYAALERAVRARGVEVRWHSPVARLLIEEGRVVGVEVRELRRNRVVRALQRALAGLTMAHRAFGAILRWVERVLSRTYLVRARGGVVIAAGGFVFNRAMMRRFARAYARCMPLGTAGDDGAGIRLGESAGGGLTSMSSCAASRFYSPPLALSEGLLVNTRGERICDETLYGATLSRQIAEQPGGLAHLVVDSRMVRLARAQMKEEERLRDHSLGDIVSGRMNALIFRKAMALSNLRLNRKRAVSLAGLARKCRLPPETLTATVAAYNRAIEQGAPDAMGKEAGLRSPILEPPFYAIDCRLGSQLFPAPCLTLGGLRVEGSTGQVLAEQGSPIPGLYAAGRSAAGICAESYVSGLSLADCIFSGRNAGRSAADAVRRSPLNHDGVAGDAPQADLSPLGPEGPGPQPDPRAAA